VELTMRDRRLREATLRRLSDQRTRLDALARALAHLDPSRVLERGYALVFDAHGHAVVDATRVMHGARLDVRLARGALDVRVEGIQDRGRSEDFGAHD
jgi:exodeoxyribonuclease VII large subunit